tara:strand:- start:116 stop:751 length:636 start_codon:yes stop_codon:yes gene_type:complete
MAETPIEVSKDSYDIYPVNVSQIKFSDKATSLSDFPEWVWYTVAPVAAWGGLNNEVLAAIQQVTSVTYHQYLFSRPVFSGFPDSKVTDWNRSLWAVPSASWNKLKDEFLAVTLVDTSTETMVKYGLQELVIHDPLYADKNAVVSLSTPKANIYSFGVMSNKKTIAFDPSSGVKELPRVFTMQPEDGIVELASKALTQKAHAEAVAQNLRNL